MGQSKSKVENEEVFSEETFALKPLSSLKTWERNYRKGDVEAIAKSVARFGFNGALRVWKDGIVMAGNHALLALRKLKESGSPVPVHIAEAGGDWYVKTIDLSHLNRYEAEAFAIADNHTQEIGSNEDAQLSAMLKELSEHDETLFKATGYDDDGLKALLANVSESGGAPPGDAGAALSRAEELKEKFGVERGQLWLAGKHRILCGDSYTDVDIDRLLDGAEPDMLNTDPPYGISIVQPRNGASAAAIGGSKPFGSTSGAARKTGVAERHARAEHVHVQHGTPSRNQIIQSNMYPVIEGDDRPFEPEPFLEFAPIVMLWGGNYFADKLPVSSCWIVWDKREDVTRNTFADCELAWTNLDKPSRLFHHLWNGLHKGSQHGQRRTHPTEKPVALFEEIGKMFCPEGIWLDLFAGTGAQVIAAERCGATCYALEYEVLYVASMLQRLVDIGLEPKLV